MFKVGETQNPWFELALALGTSAFSFVWNGPARAVSSQPQATAQPHHAHVNRNVPAQATQTARTMPGPGTSWARLMISRILEMLLRSLKSILQVKART
jgi:hypothetical protein